MTSTDAARHSGRGRGARWALHRLGLVGLLGLALACAPRAGPDPASDPLRIAVVAAPTSLDPHLQDETPAYNVLVNVYQGLVTLDGDLRLRPALAESWETPDDLTWRFHLRRGVVFHHGEPFTAADVAASLERLRHHPQSQVSSYLTGVREVRVVDPYTVDLLLESPSAVLPNKLALLWIVPRGAPDVILRPIGTGPYRWLGEEEGRHTLERFDRYWGDPPPIHRAVLEPTVQGWDREARLVEGEADLIESPSVPFLQSLSEYPELVAIGRDTADVGYLHLGLTRAPFDDPRLRLATHLALDRQALVDGPLQGVAEVATQLAPRQVFGYDPKIRSPVRDLEAARRLLVEAGYPDGVEVTLESPSRTGSTDLVVSQLTEAGFRVRHETHAWDEMYRRLQEGEVQMYFGLVSITSGDASDLFESKLHSRVPGGGMGTGNFNGYSNPELDELIEASASALDPDRRLALLHRCMGIAMADLPLVPLYVPASRYAMRRDLRFSPRVDGALEVATMSWDDSGSK